jgi:uncharacterized protein (DUF488 family)
MGVIYTVGHSTHPLEKFLGILKAHSIEQLVDVRRFPKSRRHPHFNRETMDLSLPEAGIAYRHMPGLGGMRHPRKHSTNTAWQNESFRGYADYMQTSEFERNLDELIAVSSELRTAIMCAEAVPWRCHRSLIADALIAREIDVQDIFSETSLKPHKLTPFASISGEKVTYPGLLLSPE